MISESKSYKEVNKQKYFTDKDWVRSIFLIDQEKLDSAPWEVRTWSTADTKFQDTALGGSLVINPLPQPCVFTDPVSSTHWLKKSNANDDGLSPYYSEAFDDNYRYITLRFGTMAFTSLTGFLLGMYSPTASAMVNKGLIDWAMFQMGKVVGVGVQLITWPLSLISFGAMAVNFLSRKPTSRYAYLKPNMPLYWSTVQNIVNHFAVDLGLIHRSPRLVEGQDSSLHPTDDQILHMKKIWPNVYSEGSISGGYTTGIFKLIGIGADKQGYIDAFVVATRAQRLAYKRFEVLEEISKSGGKLDVRKAFVEAYRKKDSRKVQTIHEYLSNWVNGGKSMYSLNDRNSKEGENKTINEIGDTPQVNNIDNEGFFNFLRSEIRDGGAFVSFRVNDTGEVSETFTNSYRESSLMEKVNSASATARSVYFDLAGGNIGDDFISNTIETVFSAVKSFATGVIDQIGLGGLAVVGGGGAISMPKYWESSEAQLPRITYGFTLKARYANNMARFNDIYFPLACILAGCLPLSVGKHSHSNPLYFEYYDKGRMQSRLAAIESLTITRGGGNMGFTSDGHLMSVDVSFSIIPMEEIVALPVTEGFSMGDTLINMLGVGLMVRNIGGKLLQGAAGVAGGGALTSFETMIKGIFDDTTPFMDYMATLAGLGVNEQHYLISKINRTIKYNQTQLASKYSSAKWAAFAADFLPVKIVSGLSLVVGSDYGKAFFFDERAS